jgi:hypothetical protein
VDASGATELAEGPCPSWSLDPRRQSEIGWLGSNQTKSNPNRPPEIRPLVFPLTRAPAAGLGLSASLSLGANCPSPLVNPRPRPHARPRGLFSAVDLRSNGRELDTPSHGKIVKETPGFWKSTRRPWFSRAGPCNLAD